MNAHTSRSPRTVLLAVVVGLLAVASAPAGAAEQVRTETALGGYRIDATASPLLVLLDDPSVPIPRPPGAALLEADPSFTKTSLAGHASRRRPQHRDGGAVGRLPGPGRCALPGRP